MARDAGDERTRIRQPAADPARAQPAPDETRVRGVPRPDEAAARVALGPDDTAVRGIPRPDDAAARVAPRPDETAARGVPRPNDTAVPALPRPDETAVRNPAGHARPANLGADSPAAPVPARQTRQPIAFGQGYRLRGRYELHEMIGQGAMGQVWRAKDLLGEEALDRNPYVAVKVLNSDFEGRPDAFIALHREATRAQKLAHPNIVTVYVFDRDEESGRAFVAMELLEGRPLDEVIRKGGVAGLPREEALPIIRGMAEGLSFAHRKGIVHSDFKPANIFLTRDGTPKILDFGIARAVQVAQRVAGAPVPDSVREQDDGGFQGYTINYAAPEALSGAPPSTSEDVFALGIVAYELVSGSHPFKRMSALEAQAANLQRPALRGLKRRECNAIERALSYEPAKRFTDAGAFLRQLQGIPLIQQALVAAVGVLLIAAGILWYRSYLDSLPNVPFEQLPQQAQRDFLDKVRQGNESLDYLRRTHDITASADAAQYFADAYQLHEKDPRAVSGLATAADYAIDWYRKLPDQHEARAELERFRGKSDYYQTYGPLQKAIRAAGGE